MSYHEATFRTDEPVWLAGPAGEERLPQGCEEWVTGRWEPVVVIRDRRAR